MSDVEMEWDSDGTLVLDGDDDSSGSEQEDESRRGDDSRRDSLSSIGSFDFGSDGSTDYGGEDGVEDLVEAGSPASATGFAHIANYRSIEEAMIGRDTIDEFVYTYVTRYKSRGVRATTYRCRSHVDCPRMIKIHKHNDESDFRLLGSGEHAAAVVATPVPRRLGIAVTIKSDCDSLLVLGLGAGRVRNMLLFKFVTNPVMLLDIPSTRQLENRKAYLKRTFNGGWEFDTFISLMGWCSSRMCQRREQFYAGDQTLLSTMSELIVLETFEHETTILGERVMSFGMVFTSRAVFRNVERAVRGQEGSLAISTDGTYRIHFGGWTLVDCGSVGVEYARECAFAYERMFAAVIKYAREFFDIPVEVKSASIDHAEYIASAIESSWPESEIITCWPHLARQSAKKATLLHDKSFYQGTVLVQLRLLHCARSHRQFLALGRMVIAFWREKGENEYAEWFEAVYMAPRWTRWSVHGSSFAGVLPSQQPIESHHAVIKTIVTDYKTAPTVSVLNSVIPRLLLYDTANLSSDECRHFAEGPLLTDAVVKANLHLTRPDNHLKEYGRRGTFRRQQDARGTPTRIYFNSSKAMKTEGSLCGSIVDPGRVRIFKASLGGTLSGLSTTESMQFDYLSLQVVSVDVQLADALPVFESVPVWTSENIALVRSALKCSCKSYMLSGWSCSHVVASLSLLGRFDLQRAVARVPTRSYGPGRRPSARGDGFYTLENLEQRFTRTPGQALMWPFVDQFTVRDNDTEYVEHRVGQVSTVRLGDEGMYIWTVHFISGGSKDCNVRDLAVGIRRAHVLGTR